MMCPCTWLIVMWWFLQRSCVYNYVFVVCFIGLNVDFTGVVSPVGGGGVLRGKTTTKER